MIRSLLAMTIMVLVGAPPVLALEFEHDGHLEYLEERVPEVCGTCHLSDAVSIVPAQEVCLACHEAQELAEVAMPGTKTHGPLWALNHRTFAKGQTYDCQICHEQSDCLNCHQARFADEQGEFGNAMVNVHRSDFHVTHPIAARTDPQLCSSCHENRFCADCHESFAPQDLAILSHRRGFTDGTLGGAHSAFSPEECQECHRDSVLPNHQWSNSHAREARRSLATCQACHPKGAVCLKCHSAVSGLRVNPHPEDWDDMDGRLRRASDGKTCRKCH